MPEGESFDRWLEDFTHQVDSALEGAGKPALSTPQAQQAQHAFDQWWKAEPQTQPASEPLAQKLPSPEEWPAKLERLAQERARLQQKSDSSEREIQILRGRLDTVQSEIADFETRLSRSRQSYEEHIQRLEEQVRGLREVKAFLEKSLLEELRRLRPSIQEGD